VSDARLAYCLFDKNKRLQQFIIFGGSLFAIGGKSLFESSKRVSIYEWQNGSLG
jgi:hypothetical protein